MCLSTTPVTRYDPPLLLGEHTDKVLREVLRLDMQSILKLNEEKIV